MSPAVTTKETQNTKTLDTESPVFNSPRVKGLLEFPQTEFLFKFGPKLNYGDTVNLLNKKSFNYTQTIDGTEAAEVKKGKFSSFFDLSARGKKSVPNVQFEMKTSIEVARTDTKTSQKSFPWRVFSFDKKEKVKTEENKSTIAAMVTPIKSIF